MYKVHFKPSLCCSAGSPARVLAAHCLPSYTDPKRNVWVEHSPLAFRTAWESVASEFKMILFMFL